MAENLRTAYQHRVQLDSPRAGNRVPVLQKVFSAPDGRPVFLKGKYDGRIYRTAMAFSLVGIGLTGFCIFRMATGRMTKKSSDS